MPSKGTLIIVGILLIGYFLGAKFPGVAQRLGA